MSYRASAAPQGDGPYSPHQTAQYDASAHHNTGQYTNTGQYASSGSGAVSPASPRSPAVPSYPYTFPPVSSAGFAAAVAQAAAVSARRADEDRAARARARALQQQPPQATGDGGQQGRPVFHPLARLHTATFSATQAATAAAATQQRDGDSQGGSERPFLDPNAPWLRRVAAANPDAAKSLMTLSRTLSQRSAAAANNNGYSCNHRNGYGSEDGSQNGGACSRAGGPGGSNTARGALGHYSSGTRAAHGHSQGLSRTWNPGASVYACPPPPFVATVTTPLRDSASSAHAHSPAGTGHASAGHAAAGPGTVAFSASLPRALALASQLPPRALSPRAAAVKPAAPPCSTPAAAAAAAAAAAGLPLPAGAGAVWDKAPRVTWPHHVASTWVAPGHARAQTAAVIAARLGMPVPRPGPESGPGPGPGPGPETSDAAPNEDEAVAESAPTESDETKTHVDAPAAAADGSQAVAHSRSQSQSEPQSQTQLQQQEQGFGTGTEKPATATTGTAPEVETKDGAEADASLAAADPQPQTQPEAPNTTPNAEPDKKQQQQQPQQSPRQQSSPRQSAPPQVPPLPLSMYHRLVPNQPLTATLPIPHTAQASSTGSPGAGTGAAAAVSPYPPLPPSTIGARTQASHAPTLAPGASMYGPGRGDTRGPLADPAAAVWAPVAARQQRDREQFEARRARHWTGPYGFPAPEGPPVVHPEPRPRLCGGAEDAGATMGGAGGERDPVTGESWSWGRTARGPGSPPPRGGLMRPKTRTLVALTAADEAKRARQEKARNSQGQHSHSASPSRIQRKGSKGRGLTLTTGLDVPGPGSYAQEDYRALGAYWELQRRIEEHEHDGYGNRNNSTHKSKAHNSETMGAGSGTERDSHSGGTVRQQQQQHYGRPAHEADGGNRGINHGNNGEPEASAAPRYMQPTKASARASTFVPPGCVAAQQQHDRERERPGVFDASRVALKMRPPPTPLVTSRTALGAALGVGLE